MTTFASGLDFPNGLAIDSQNNLYVANAINGTVDKITPTGSATQIASGFAGAQGVAVGSGGNIYVTDYAADTLTEITPQGTKIVLATGLPHPDYMVVVVPEPSVAALFTLAGFAIFLIRRR